MVGTGLRRRALVALSLVGALVLGGCVDNLPVVAVGKGDIWDAIAKGQLTSPKAATVAVVSLEGAPDSVLARVRQALNDEAAHREITITDAASARYLLRGYLAAYADEGNVVVSYTYDVFDAGGRRRQQRVADTLTLPATGADAWQAVNAFAVTSLAGHSADELAVALSGMPESQANKVAATAASAAIVQ